MNKIYNISELTPFINWLYFYHAWGLSGKPREDKEKMKQEALQMLASWEEKYHTHAIFRLFEVCSEGDDLIFFYPIKNSDSRCSASSILRRQANPISALPTSSVPFPRASETR